MSRPSSSPVLALVLVLLVGCSASPLLEASTSGTIQLAVSTPAALPADVSRVTVTVSASDMASRVTSLQATDGSWGGVLGNLPAGAHRTFLAQAFNAANTLRYQGRAEDVTITAGTTGLVTLILQDLSPPPTVANEAPLVDSLVATPTTVAPGGSVSLTASAHDPNPGDSVSLAWSASSGRFSAPTQASTTWTAPTFQGPVKLSLTVSDSRGATLVQSLTVMVSAGSGAQEVRVGFNSAPQVGYLGASQSVLDVGQQTVLSLSATDPDGDALDYQWSATCAGTFSFEGSTRGSATFTPLALPAFGCDNCQVNVVVKDGRGGQNTASLSLCVSKDVIWSAPPQFTRAFQSSLTATAHQQLTFEAGARDPQGSALTFSWGASAGLLGAAVTGTDITRITWTAPDCAYLGDALSLTVTAANSRGLTATKSFLVTGLPACGVSTWTPVSGMSTPRRAHVAMGLPDGRVLVAGGNNGGIELATAEVYNLATNSWSPTAPLSVPRSSPMAARLSDGKVLVVGGFNSSDGELYSSEVYDPATATWGFLNYTLIPRSGATLTPLSTGRVLLTGGLFNNSYFVQWTEFYDPASNSWGYSYGYMISPRRAHTATLLPSGRVLVAGGLNAAGTLSQAEVYDPVTDSWNPTGDMHQARSSHTATLLPSGQVLVAGGVDGSGNPLATAELYDPATGSWSTTGDMLSLRHDQKAVLLSTGVVLLAGGYSHTGIPDAERYDPNTHSWSSAGIMTAQRFGLELTPLPNGRALATGGANATSTLASAEFY